MRSSSVLRDAVATSSLTTAQLALPRPLENALRDPYVERLEAALAYAAYGWPVLPCCWPDEHGNCACGRAHKTREVGKAPLLRNGVHGATTDPATIENWWTEWPLANIGLAVEPAGLLVLDLDGREAVDEALPYGLPPSPVSKTGRPDGEHRFFKNPWPGMASATKRGRSKLIDIKVTGQVILPGSTHASGAHYAWALSPGEAPPQRAPEWVKRYLRPAVVPAEVQLPEVLPVVTPAALHVPKKIKELIPEERPGGYPSRSEAGFAVVAAMAAGGHSDEEIAAVMLSQPIGAYIRGKSRPDEFLVGEIGRARAKATNQSHLQAQEALRSSAATSPRHRSLYTAAELLATEIPEPRWVVEGILPEGLTLLAGKPKVGKSWLCLQLALLLAGGVNDLGSGTAFVGDVLYLALEDNDRRLRQRLSALVGDQPAPATLHLATGWERLSYGGLDRLRAFLAEHRETRLIVIDTLARVRAASSGRRSAYEIDYEDLAGPQSLAAEHPGLGVLVVHHLRKNAAADPLDCVSGTTALTACADAVMVMSNGRGRERFDARLFLTGRDVEERDFALKREDDSPGWRFLGDATELALSEQQRKIVTFLRELAEPAGPKAIANGTGVPHGSVKHLVRKLVDSGHILRGDNGTYCAAAHVHREASNHSVHPVHHDHLTHSNLSPSGVRVGECPPFTGQMQLRTGQSLCGERGEHSRGEGGLVDLGALEQPSRLPPAQGRDGGEP